jgi:hypothetical protein
MDNSTDNAAAGGIEYEYSREILEKYRKTPDEWKLDWLEEVNAMTFLSLSEKQKKSREKLRRGEM